MDLDLGSNVSGLSELAAAVRAAAPQPQAGGKKGKKGKREYEEEGGRRGRWTGRRWREWRPVYLAGLTLAATASKLNRARSGRLAGGGSGGGGGGGGGGGDGAILDQLPFAGHHAQGQTRSWANQVQERRATDSAGGAGGGSRSSPRPVKARWFD